MNQTKDNEKGLQQEDRAVLKKGQENISNKQKETFSRRELEDLMGCNRDTYKRVRGSVKSRKVDLIWITGQID